MPNKIIVDSVEIDEMQLKLLSEQIQSTRYFDSNESIYLAKDLLVKEAKVYEVKYPNLLIRQIVPLGLTKGEGIDSIGYDQMDMFGEADFVGEKGQEYKRVDVKLAEFLKKVRHIGDSYGWDWYEMKEAIRAKKSLSTDRALAARRAIETKIDNLGWTGNKERGVDGILSDITKLTEYTLPADGNENGGSSSKKLIHKTAKQCIRDLTAIANKTNVFTKGIFQNDTMVLDTETYDYLSTLDKSDHSDASVLDHIKAKTTVKNITSTSKLAGVTATGISNKDVILCFPRLSEIWTLEIPSEFQQLPVFWNGKEWTVNCSADVVGIFFKHPKTIVIALQ